MLANSLDPSGSSGRPIAAEQKRPTTRALRQSNTTQAILTVIEPPHIPFADLATRVHLATPDARVHAGRVGIAHFLLIANRLDTNDTYHQVGRPCWARLPARSPGLPKSDANIWILAPGAP